MIFRIRIRSGNLCRPWLEDQRIFLLLQECMRGFAITVSFSYAQLNFYNTSLHSINESCIITTDKILSLEISSSIGNIICLSVIALEISHISICSILLMLRWYFLEYY